MWSLIRNLNAYQRSDNLESKLWCPQFSQKINIGIISSKVHIFWEGLKILRNLHQLFVLCTASQIIGGYFAKFCGLLRIYQVYTKLSQPSSFGRIEDTINCFRDLLTFITTLHTRGGRPKYMGECSSKKVVEKGLTDLPNNGRCIYM